MNVTVNCRLCMDKTEKRKLEAEIKKIKRLAAAGKFEEVITRLQVLQRFFRELMQDQELSPEQLELLEAEILPLLEAMTQGEYSNELFDLLRELINSL